MPRPRSTVPSYRLHKPSGRAVVTVRGADGETRDVYLGRHGSPESRAAYARTLAELRAAPGAELPVAGRPAEVADVIVAFMRHAVDYYRRADGSPTGEVKEYRAALRVVAALYADDPAAGFGPLALKAVRRAMIDKGWCRKVVNARVNRVRRAFKWAASEQLVTGAAFAALQAVAGLQRGRTEAPEREPVGPAGDADVDETLPHLTPTVAAMVRFQRLTGCRPQDACQLRGDAIDRAGPVWVFRPAEHKGAWRGSVRELRIGPRAQAVITPFLLRAAGGILFTPAASKAEHLAARRAGRGTPLFPSQERRYDRQRKRRPARIPGGQFTAASYGYAIRRAIARANRGRVGVPEGFVGPTLPPVGRWAPNQIRHAMGTDVRKRFGLEAAQVLLGHARADVTQVYAERDAALAERVALEVG